MHLIPMTPPAHVQTLSGFDYVATDAERRRVYAAHTGSNALLIVNADGGAVLGQVKVGPMHGVAVDPASGHVYTGDGEQRTVSEVDPVAMTVVSSAAVDGKVDAIAYDAVLHRVYADEDDGTRIFVVDTLTMKETATIQIPGHKPEYLAIDAKSHELYQNIDDLAETVVIDPQTLKVIRTIATPAIKHDHPLIYDQAYGILLVGGKNSLVAAYTRDGNLLSTAPVPVGIDQCAFDSGTHRLACAGSGKATVLQLSKAGALTDIADVDLPKEVHTMAFDEKTGHLWIVWADATGDFVQELALAP
ncbi:MAG TPA: YncE family protein [Candidatus Eremiobacteraceae bacterium]